MDSIVSQFGGVSVPGAEEADAVVVSFVVGLVDVRLVDVESVVDELCAPELAAALFPITGVAAGDELTTDAAAAVLGARVGVLLQAVISAALANMKKRR